MKQSKNNKNTKTNVKKAKYMKKNKTRTKKKLVNKRVKKGGNGNKLGQISYNTNNESNSDTEFHNALDSHNNQPTETREILKESEIRNILRFNNVQEEEENFFNKKTVKNMAMPSFIVIAFIGGIVALATS